MQVLDQVRLVSPTVHDFSCDRAAAADLPTAEEVRAELARAIGSEDFPATPRNRRFLSFVVEHALRRTPEAGRVSSRELALRIFGRPESFDSVVDAIVRIEATKLRRDLEVYYLKSGRKNPLRIEIPRGGYDPVFIRQNNGDAPAPPAKPVLSGNLAEDVSAELKRILGSRDFPATARNRKFLAYVVRKELEGAPQEITSRHVAKSVFGRRSSFDPNKDPIVRIEAGRLRRDLEVYYLKSGQSSPLRITIPKGGYRPVFQVTA